MQVEDLPKAPPPKGQLDLIPANGDEATLLQSTREGDARREARQTMLQLAADEQAWLDSYRAALHEKHPGTVQEMLIYGSKARGQAHAESDVDVLLIVKNNARVFKRELRWIGYLLAAKTDVLPSILAYTEEEWESRRRSGSTFRKAVERDAVRVA